MREDRISKTQLMALVWAGLLAPVAELLPGALLPQVGRGTWVAAVLAIPLALLAGWLLGRASGGQGLAQGICQTFGAGWGRAILTIYMVWALVLLALRLRMGGQRLIYAGEKEGALWFFLASVGAMLAWIGRGKLSALARAGQIFLGALLAAAGVVLVLSLPQVRPWRLFPVTWPGAGEMVQGTLRYTGVLGWGLFAAFLLGRVEEDGSGWRRHWLLWGGGGLALLATAQGIVLGALGAGLAQRLEAPFFSLAKSIGVEGAFQRVEGIIAALWAFSDLAMGGVLIFAIREMALALWPRAGRWSGLAATLAGAVGVAALLRSQERAGYIAAEVAPVVDLVLGIGGPALLILVRGASGKWRKGRISCGGERPKTEDIG